MTEDCTNDTAGAGSPAPAVPSVPGPVSVDVPPEARVELDRLRRRWGELPLARAEAAMPLLRGLLDDLGRRSAPEESSVPDLGPGVVAHQLAVLVWDAYAVGRADGIPALLTDLRRTLN